MFFEQKKLISSEIEQKEKEFGGILVDLEKSAILWKELRDFFTYNTTDDYRFTYWRWFVELTWYRFNTLSKEDLEGVMASQIPSALLQNYNVQDEILRYLGLRSIDEQEAQSLYVKMQKAFLESGALVGLWKGMELKVVDLAKEIDQISKQNDSLEEAEFESKLKQIMFPNDPLANKYVTAGPDEAVRRFIDLVNFFQTFTQENIWYIVDSFLNPEKYQNAPRGEALPKVAPTPKAEPKIETPKKEEVKLVVPPEIRSKPTLQEIKSQMESQFKKDAEGNFEEVETVLAMLSTLSEKYEEPKIADMLYFDEKESKFKWNI